MIDTPKYAPHGYCPFEIEFEGRRGWICATPHCDAADDLCYQVGIDTDDGPRYLPFTEYGEHEPITYYSRDRIPAFFGTEEEATKACWAHARHWWGGEPPSTWAIPAWNKLPTGYRIFIEVEQRRMWVIKPDGTQYGECSGVSLSSAMDAYAASMWEESHEQQAHEQDDDERERIRAWVQDDEPRRWSLIRDDDGDYRPGLPEGHYVEMRIYMPHEMVRDIEAILNHCDGPRMGIQGHFKEWAEAGIRGAADEALTGMKEHEKGG